MVTFYYHTTRMAGRPDWACKHRQSARALVIVDCPGNDDRMGILTYCGSIDRSNRRLAGDDCNKLSISMEQGPSSDANIRLLSQ
jgi:hypothetical protein